MEFQSVEQRMIHTYIDTFPPFVPKSGGDVSVAEQEEFYNFLRTVYKMIFEEPELLFSALHDDGIYRYRYNRAYDKNPKLYTAMQAATKKIDAFIEFLFVSGQQGAVPQANKKYNEILAKCDFKEISPAWRELSTRYGATTFSFGKCMFDENYDYCGAVFARLLGDYAAYKALIDFLQKNGYQRQYGVSKKFAVDYTKNYGKTDEPLKDSWAEREHAGVSMFYDFFVARPAVITLRMPRHKDLLARFDSLDGGMQKFILGKNKRCDGCGYCTMGKSKSPNIASVLYEGESYNLCPLFPGFYFGWIELNLETTKNIINYLTLVDSLYQK